MCSCASLGARWISEWHFVQKGGLEAKLVFASSDPSSENLQKINRNADSFSPARLIPSKRISDMNSPGDVSPNKLFSESATSSAHTGNTRKSKKKAKCVSFDMRDASAQR